MGNAENNGADKGDMVDQQKLYAVMTGDLVGGKTFFADGGEKKLQDLKNVLQEIRLRYDDDMVSDFAVVRGDEIQGVLTAPEKGLEALVYARLSILTAFAQEGVDIRLAVGVGGVDYINADDISSSNGEAFVLSGRALEDMKNEEKANKGRKRTGVRTPSSRINLEFDAVCSLFDVVASRWTRNQMEILRCSLAGLQQKEVAAAMGKRQSTISESLTRSGEWAIEKMLHLYKEEIQRLSRGNSA